MVEPGITVAGGEEPDVSQIASELHADYTVLDLAMENTAATRRDARLATKRPSLHLWTDEDEWSQWNKVRDPILHIELRRWADVVLIAPCSADLLAKLNAGICDSLVVSVEPFFPSLVSFLMQPHAPYHEDWV